MCGWHPPMYSANQSSIFLFRDPIEFSKNLHPHCLVSQICKSGKHQGQQYQIVKRFLTSLQELNLPMYYRIAMKKNTFFSHKNCFNPKKKSFYEFSFSFQNEQTFWNSHIVYFLAFPQLNQQHNHEQKEQWNKDHVKIP